MDVELACRARAGDQAAFEALLRQHGRAMLQFADFVLHDLSAAEDAVQEAFFMAWRRRDRLDDPAAFVPWLRRIVLRACLRWRRRPIWRALTVADRVLDPGTADPVRHVDVANAVRHLSPRLRAVVFLHFFEDQTLASVARELGIPMSTAKTRLYEALRRLKRMLADYEPPLSQEQSP